MPKGVPLDAKRIEKALIDNAGNVSAAARSLGVTRQAISRRVAKSKTLHSVLSEQRETMIDNAESVLYSKVLEGEAWAVCFFLKTQAKHRGYTERQEVTGADGGALEIKLTWGD